MNDKPLPPDLEHFAHLPDLAFRGRDEWSSACPHCGGADKARRDKSDRFRLFAADDKGNARVWCRNCNHFEWADQDGETPSREAIEAATAERLRLAKQERGRLERKIKNLTTESYWRGWHDAMQEKHRRMWHDEGIIDWAIDEYMLGYCADYTAWVGADEWHTPTMTIPHWGPDHEIRNIQHRLLNPPAPGDKYRQMAGLPAAMFLTEPDEPLSGAVLVVEGAKKAIVTYTNLGTSPMGGPLTVVGVPSKTPSATMLDQLEECDPIYVALDPDAYTSAFVDGKSLTPAVNRVADKLNRERVKIVKLPVKPDDFFVLFGGNAREFVDFLKVAKPAC
jgi:hypothetical protein